MPSIQTFSALLAFAATVFAGPLTARAQSSNVVVYWGQGNNRPLSTVCADPSVDTVVLGFVHIFPDQDPNNYPGSNFADACAAGSYYKTSSGATTQLLVGCTDIAQGIQTCHQNNKKVLLSLGGGYPARNFITNTTTANYFADFLYGAFGPQTTAWVNAGKPRPFGQQTVDGFDFDIESDFGSTTPTDQAGNSVPNYKWQNYAAMITRLRTNAQTAGTPILITGAPQCVIPDAHLYDAIANSYFDALFVQFYNTNGCSARDGVSTINGVTGGGDISFNKWATNSNNGVPSQNPNVPIYIGLAASTSAATNAEFYITPDEAYQLVSKFYPNARFGGISVWADTFSANNVICGKSYAAWMRQILQTLATGGKWTSAASCPTSSSTSSTSTSTSVPVKVPSTTSTTSSTTSTSTTSTSTTSSTTSTPTSKTSTSTSTSVTSTTTPPVKAPSTTSTSSTTSSSSSTTSTTSKASTSTTTSLTAITSSTKTSASTSSTFKAAGNGKAIDPTASFTLDPSGNDPIGSDPTTTNLPTWTSSPGWYFSNSSAPAVTPAPSTWALGTAGVVTTTVITTAYVDICPTGFTTVTTTYTTTVCPSSTSKPAVPEGWKTTVTVCSVCGPKPTTVTLTKPITVTKSEPKTWAGTTPASNKDEVWVTTSSKPDESKPVTWAKTWSESDSTLTSTVRKTSTVAWAVGPTASAGWTKTTSPGMAMYTGAAAGKMVGGIGAGAAAFVAAAFVL